MGLVEIICGRNVNIANDIFCGVQEGGLQRDTPKQLQVTPGEDFTTLADQRLLTTALKKYRWNIPEKVKQRAIDCIRDILDSDDNKLKMQAVKNLALLDKLNIEEERLHEPVKHIHINVDTLTQQELENQIKELLNGIGYRRFIDEHDTRTLGRIA